MLLCIGKLIWEGGRLLFTQEIDFDWCRCVSRVCSAPRALVADILLLSDDFTRDCFII